MSQCTLVFTSAEAGICEEVSSVWIDVARQDPAVRVGRGAARRLGSLFAASLT